MDDPLALALRFLPHGPEFRFLDRVVQLEPGVCGSAEYTLRGDEPFLRGHFPNQPMMPGVLLIEAMAQLAGSVAQSDPARQPLANLRLTALRAVKIFGTAVPGEKLEIKANVTGRLGKLVQARGAVMLGTRMVAEAELTLSGDVMREKAVPADLIAHHASHFE